jgi:hypothetical protein
MARTRSRPGSLLDTSAVVYQRHGHSLQRAAVRAAVAGRDVQVPVFVRMEYLRGIVLNLIEMWCLIRESVTVADAFVDWSQKVRQERKLKVILMTVPQWLVGHDGWESRDRTLRRLGDLILRLVWGFDEAYPHPPADPLLDFYERFKSIQEGVPDCRQCAFRQVQRRRLRRRQVDLTGPESRQRYAGNQGFVRQVDALQEAETLQDRRPQCHWCEQLGDTLLALQARRGVVLVTADRSFLAWGELLGQPVVLLPSLAELKRRAAEDGTQGNLPSGETS